MTARLVGLVPAAGGGSRFGTHTPKQYLPLAGEPLLACTVQRLLDGLDFAALYVVVAPGDALAERTLRPFATRVTVLRCGGPTRAATVRNALEAIGRECAEDDWVLVHDAARPCVPADALRRLLSALDAEEVGALLATPVADTLKRAAGDASGGAPRVLRTEDRAELWQAQTPQVFRAGLLRAALALPVSAAATDEAQAIEALAATGRCAMPRLVLGSALNVKVTYPADLALAGAIRMLGAGVT